MHARVRSEIRHFFAIVSASFASRFAVNAVVFQLASSRTVQQHVHMMKAVLLLSNSGSAILGEVLRDAHALSLPEARLYPRLHVIHRTSPS
eukprot:s1300_g2.t1